jgi:hypothetical protein
LLDPWESNCSKEKNKHIYVDSTKKTIRVKPKDKNPSKERAKSAIGGKPHRNEIYNRFDDLHYENYISYHPVRLGNLGRPQFNRSFYLRKEMNTTKITDAKELRKEKSQTWKLDKNIQRRLAESIGLKRPRPSSGYRDYLCRPKKAQDTEPPEPNDSLNSPKTLIPSKPPETAYSNPWRNWKRDRFEFGPEGPNDGSQKTAKMILKKKNQDLDKSNYLTNPYLKGKVKRMTLDIGNRDAIHSNYERNKISLPCRSSIGVQKINKLKVVCDEILNDKWKNKKSKQFKYDASKGVFFRKAGKGQARGLGESSGKKANNFQDNITRIFENEGVISGNKKKLSRSKKFKKSSGGAPFEIEYSDLQAIRNIEMGQFAGMGEHSTDSEDIMKPLVRRRPKGEESSEECIFFIPKIKNRLGRHPWHSGQWSALQIIL